MNKNKYLNSASDVFDEFFNTYVRKICISYKDVIKNGQMNFLHCEDIHCNHYLFPPFSQCKLFT